MGPRDRPVWTPLLLVAALFVGLVFGTATLSSNTMADLVGLIYLLGSPVLYRRLRSILAADAGLSLRSSIRHAWRDGLSRG